MTIIRMLLDIVATVAVGLTVAAVMVCISPILLLYIIASNWDWEYRS